MNCINNEADMIKRYYLASACMHSKGIRNDCYELKTLYKFVTWLKNQENGEKIIQKYCEIAPEIVTEIDKRKDRKEVYDVIYLLLVARSVKLCEKGNYEEVLRLYKICVPGLYDIYC